MNNKAQTSLHIAHLVSTFVIGLLENTISKLDTSKFSVFWLVSVAQETGRVSFCQKHRRQVLSRGGPNGIEDKAKKISSLTYPPSLYFIVCCIILINQSYPMAPWKTVWILAGVDQDFVFQEATCISRVIINKVMYNSLDSNI